jgi:2-oxoglutarate dehydrogenase E2 component (dihydrolipoamide succinyltransferase)
MIEILIPQLGESVVEATVSKWLKRIGDRVSVDEPVVELETDKVTVEVPAPVSGVLVSKAIPVGQTVGVGTVIGAIDSARQLSEHNESNELPTAIANGGQPATTRAPLCAEVGPHPAKIAAAPLSNSLHGESHSESHLEVRIPISPLRVKLAEQMKEAQDTAAILTTFNEVDLSPALAAIKLHGKRFEERHGNILGLISLFVKAAARALKDVPAINAVIQGDDIVYRQYSNIGVAISTETGFVVPVIRDADRLSLAAIAMSIAGFEKAARAGDLNLHDLSGGTFTILNSYGEGPLFAMSILNASQSATLSLHKLQERPMAIGGAILVRPMMYMTLSYDHRIVDGKDAITFLVRIKERMEDLQRSVLEI